MSDSGGFISLTGPLELIDGKLTLNIPLAVGRELIGCCRRISEVRGEFLVILIPEFIADKIDVGAGSMVTVNNQDGKFHMRKSDSQDEPISTGI